MNNCLSEIISFDFGIVVVLALVGDGADGDGALWAELEAPKALDTVGAYLSLTVHDLNILSWADPCALTAGYTGAADIELSCFLTCYL